MIPKYKEHRRYSSIIEDKEIIGEYLSCVILLNKNGSILEETNFEESGDIVSVQKTTYLGKWVLTDHYQNYIHGIYTKTENTYENDLMTSSLIKYNKHSDYEGSVLIDGLSSLTKYSYTSEGKGLSIQEYNHLQELDSFSEISYHKEGSVILQKDYNSDKELLGMSKKTLDEKGNVIDFQEESIENNESFLSQTIDEFSDAGLPLKRRFFIEDSITSETVFEYNEQGLKTKETTTEYPEKETLIGVYTYNDAGQLIKDETIINDDLRRVEMFSYYPNGLLMETTINEFGFFEGKEEIDVIHFREEYDLY